MPGWWVTNFTYKKLVVSSYNPLAMIEIGEATCKEFRLPVSKLEVQLRNNTKEKVYRLTREVEKATVRNPDK